MDMSQWVIHGHCLNLKICQASQRVEDINFSWMQIQVKVHVLSPDMMNWDNTKKITNNLGKRIKLEKEADMQNRGFVRMKTEVNINNPLLAGFQWTNARGEEKWVSIKYERLLDFCYGCGKLGHTSQGCESETVLFEVNPSVPMYGPWLSGTRPRKQTGWYQIGSENHAQRQTIDPNRKSWKDIMGEGNAGIVEKAIITKESKEQDVSSLSGMNERIRCIKQEALPELSFFQKDPDPKLTDNLLEPLPNLNLSLELSCPKKILP